MPEMTVAAADPCSPARLRGSAAGTKSGQNYAGHDTGVDTSVAEIVNRDVLAELSLGEGAWCDRDGTPAVFDLTAHDTLVIARLQDVEDHPDLLPVEA
jgi:hypothetical protein